MGCLQSSENVRQIEHETQTIFSIKDDWQVFVKSPPKVVAPSFIRLFVIRRILAECLKNNQKNSDIKGLVSIFNDDEMRKLAYNILSRLMKGRNGLEKYMKNWYNEEEQAVLIETIFNDIILAKFPQQYQRITTYISNNGNNNFENDYYQCLVFNTNDLMYLIFQYLNFWNNELYYCTLVHTHFLCQIWNSTSLYHVRLSSLIARTLKYEIGDENMCTRMWQRIINAKYIDFYLDTRHPPCPAPNMLVLNRLSMLCNIEYLRCCIQDKHIDMLKVLIEKCGDKIQRFEVSVNPPWHYGERKQNNIAPLKLINAKYITIKNLYFYITWTVKCQQLKLEIDDQDGWKISEQWCNHVINNCDCSGVEILTLNRFIFDTWMIDNFKSKSTKEVIHNFGSKFNNLKKLCTATMKKTSTDECGLYFLRSLKKIREVKLIDIVTAEAIKNYNCCQIEILDICLGSLSGYVDKNYFQQVLESIVENIKDLKFLRINILPNPYTTRSILSIFGKELQSMFGTSTIQSTTIGALEITATDLKILKVINFLGLDIIDRLRSYIFVKLVLEIDRRDTHADYNYFQQKVAVLCNILKSYLVQNSKPIDISIGFLGITTATFTNVQTQTSINGGIFELCKENKGKEYKKPQLNPNQKQWCQSLVLPHVSFCLENKRSSGNFVVNLATLHVANVRICKRNDY